MRGPFATVVVGLSVGLVCLSAHPRQQQPGTFRSRITMVPVDVRVVDRNGKPVTDLKQEDFILLEDGVRQDIRHFSAQTLTPQPVVKADAKPEYRSPDQTTIAPRNQRIFLIVLGRGRQNGPGNDIDALAKFVRTKLLPQDQVAVMAWNRATDFTTDHEKVALVIDRFRKQHEAIETKLSEYFSGLRAMYGSRDIPAFIQAYIAKVFEGSSDLRTRNMATQTTSSSIDADTRRTAENIQRTETTANYDKPVMTDIAGDAETDSLGLSLDEYVARNVSTMQDVGNLYAGINYLRYLEGEKHLVYMTTRGLFLPRVENENGLAAVANDARVVLDVIQTGGVIGAPPPTGRGSSPLPSASAFFNSTFADQGSRAIAQLTGGTSSLYQSGDKSFGKIDDVTRFDYLLGYYPSNTNFNGRYRRITIRVNRPGVQVYFRHGYFGRSETIPFDRKLFLTYSRVTAAANFANEIHDLKLWLKEPEVTGSKEAPEVVISLAIEPEKLALAEKDGKRVGSLDVLVYCGDKNQRIIGERWQTITFDLAPDSYAKLMKVGVPYNSTVPVQGEPKFVKVIVYNYDADLVGTAMAQIKTR